MMLTHGGDWAGYETEYGKMPLDFSANVSPLGLPEGVRKAAEHALTNSGHYPDPLCRVLCDALGEHYGVNPEHILCGNGAADLIFRLCYAVRAKRALITAPAFSEYGEALRAAGTEIDEYPLFEENEFRPREDILSYITPETGLVFMCEPSNPAGTLCGKELLLKILDKCRETGAILALDECFNEFLDSSKEASLIPYIEGGSIIIIRAFTKFYAMAGLRAGYCFCSDTELLEKMRKNGPPWNVSSVAQAAGIAALREKDYGERLLGIIKEEREYLYNELSSLGFKVIPGKADFLLFKSEREDLAEEMKLRGILIRDCGNYSGLHKGWYRVAVKLHEDNIKLISAFREVLGNG